MHDSKRSLRIELSLAVTHPLRHSRSSTADTPACNFLAALSVARSQCQTLLTHAEGNATTTA